MNLLDRDRARGLRSDEPVAERGRYGPRPHARLVAGETATAADGGSVDPGRAP
jgi:hypothetical protein